jgi:hypothetical protein
MKKFLWVLLFAVSFFIKAVTVFGAEASKTSKTKAKELKPANVKVMTSETDSDESQSSEGESNASEMKIQNNITFGQVSSPIDYAQRADSPGNQVNTSEPPQSNKNNKVGNNSTEVQSSQTRNVGIALIPMAGGTMYQGRWNNHIRNNYTLGAALELSIIPLLSLEAEVAQGRYYISYLGYGHNFTQYTYGGSAKFYLTRGVVQTYLGGGVLGLTYQNMTYGINSNSTFDRTVGAGQFLAGAEIALSNQVSLGVRGSYIAPLFNRVNAMNNGNYAYPSFEEYSAMDTAMYRLMGSLKISL